MDLGSLPPWLSVSPQHFLEAAQGGFNTGLKIAETQNQAQQARERADLAAQENALRAWEEQQRMQYRVQELESERERRDLERQALADYRNQQLGLNTGRLEELGRHNLAMEEKGLLSENAKSLAQQTFAQKYQEGIAGGLTSKEAMRKALLQAPALLTPTTMGGAFGDERDTGVRGNSALGIVADPMKSALLESVIGPEKFADLVALAKNAIPPSAGMRTNAVPLMSPMTQTNEVTRYTKDGRKAVFDAVTKKFLRYGD